MDTGSIAVAIADDQEMVRYGFSLIVEHEPDMHVCAEAADGAAVVAAALRARPDVVLMDIRMPGLDGIAATAAIRTDETLANTRVIILTTFGEDEYVLQALRAGASGFLLKDCTPQELVDAIRVVAAGEQLLDPTVTRAVIERCLALEAGAGAGSAISHAPHATTKPTAQTRQSLTWLQRLSAREQEIWDLVARGLSNREIAAALGITEATVKAHLTSLFEKLGVNGRVQAVILAYDTGLVTPN